MGNTKKGLIIALVICICLCVCAIIISLGSYIWYTSSKSTSITPINKKPKNTVVIPTPITLDKDPNLIYNYTVSSNSKVLMSGKVSSEILINNMNTSFLSNGLTINAKVDPNNNNATVIEHYKINDNENTFYLTTDSENMLYVLMLILPDYVKLTNTIISTNASSPITITSGMKPVALRTLVNLAS
jgi:hypothetical protein